MALMNENQWQWLRPYGGIARWVGWLLILFGVWDLAMIIYGTYDTRYVSNQPLAILLPHSLDMAWHLLRNELMPGFLALGVAQFLRWLTDRELQPGWLLRQGPRLLIFAAAIYFIQVGLMIWRIPGVIRMLDKPEYNMNPSIITAFTIIPNLLMQGAPVIILLGLAEALRRIGPIVHESKELV